MKSIITGAAGFIGSNLAKELLEKNEEVIGIDCFIDYYPRWIKEKNLNKLKDFENFTFIEKNILDIDWDELIDDGDIIYHQAAQAGVRASWGDEFEIYSKNNIKATQYLLEAAKRNNIKKFVYASSSSVYGDTDNLPMKETNKLQPVSPYGVSKLAGENLCYLYWKNFDVPTVSLRYFTVFGEGQRPDMAFHIFIKNILEGNEIKIFGDGKQSRNFTHVSDVVRANILAGRSDIEGEIFNVGGAGDRIELNKTIDIIENIIGKKAEREYLPMAKGDVRHTEADETKIRTMLDYEPKIGMVEGLKREVEYIKKLYGR